MKIKHGCTRMVFLIGKYAIKIPQIKYGWKMFLLGLLGNMQERHFNTMKDKRMCPVLFSLPGGFLNIMPKCKPISLTEFEEIDIDHFWEQKFNLIEDKIMYYGDCKVPVEYKQCSFGWYNDKIVAIDYGS